jgi:hypothetical protein
LQIVTKVWRETHQGSAIGFQKLMQEELSSGTHLEAIGKIWENLAQKLIIWLCCRLVLVVLV